LGIEWFFEWDFEELALQPAGSRAQDAIKRLDCGTQPMGLMSD
jgi:hypothetical protein